MKRLVAAPLWFLAGWYLGASVAWAFGLSPIFGPVVAVAIAVVIVGDPRRVIWTRDLDARQQLAGQRA